MIFTRKIDDGLTSLVKRLDAMVADNEEKKMAALVNFVGEDPDALQKEAADFGGKNKIVNTALIVPKDHADGPKQYGINAETSVAVILYRDKKVKILHTLAEGKLTKQQIAAIVKDADELLVEEKNDEKQ